mgnify:CR=1 FL=1
MTARERTLAYSFIGILVAGGAFLAAAQLRNWKQRVDQAEYDLAMLRAEAEILMSQKDLWLQRADWINSRQPEFTNRRDADTELNRIVQDSMSERNIDAVQNQPSEPTEMPGLFASTMMVQARPSCTHAMSWLYHLQQPGSFISIPSISITPDEEDASQVNISLVLQKWYRKSDA